MEDFKDIPGFEGKYRINKRGEIWNVKRKQIKKTSKTKRGYEYAHLYKSGTCFARSVHLIMAITFLHHNPSHEWVVDHIDETLLIIN